MNAVPIAIAGAGGRMGAALRECLRGRADLHLVGATERAGDALFASPFADGARLSADPGEAAAQAQVWIDFTTPAATCAALDALEQTEVRALIIGTTGFSPTQEAALAHAARRFAIVRSGNFSLGVTLLAALVEQAAARLGPHWDIEILETHHRRKVDAPSGTALLLGDAAARGRGGSPAQRALGERNGLREPGAIGFSVRRGGGIVGEHEVMFAAEHESVRLSHQAFDRRVFAEGALAAALWAHDKPPGLYALRDVLGL